MITLQTRDGCIPRFFSFKWSTDMNIVSSSYKSIKEHCSFLFSLQQENLMFNISFKKRRRNRVLNCWYISIQTSWPIIKECQHNNHFVLFTSWHWGDMMSNYFREQCCIKWPCWNWNDSIYPLIHSSEMYCARLLPLDKTDELSRNLRLKDGYLRR
jgi:hypothetical protein